MINEFSPYLLIIALETESNLCEPRPCQCCDPAKTNTVKLMYVPAPPFTPANERLEKRNERFQNGIKSDSKSAGARPKACHAKSGFYKLDKKS